MSAPAAALPLLNGHPVGLVLDPAVALVLERVRLLARRRLAWLRHLWTDVATAGDELDAILDDRDDPLAEAVWLARHPAAESWAETLGETERRLAADGSRFALLHRLFGLSAAESDLFQLALALAVDPGLGRVYAELQGSRELAFATDGLAARLGGHGYALPWSAASALRRWELIEEREGAPGEPAALLCDGAIRTWLLGHDDLDPALVGVAAFQPTLPPLGGWPVAQTAALIGRTLEGGRTGGIRVRVVGPPGSGRRTLAAAVVAELGLPLLVVDAGRVEEAAWARVVRRANRQALLGGFALAWHGEGVDRRPWPDLAPRFPIQFTIAENAEDGASSPGVVDHVVEVPPPSVEERRALWRAAVPATAGWAAAEMTRLELRHRAPIGEIAAIGRSGASSPAEVVAAARAAGRRQLGSLAQTLECPFGWDDLVVGPDIRQALDDLVFEARERAAFWERPEARRLFPEGRGLLALFSGPPGTGKTMAAQVIAAALELDLLRIDLSSVVSKYVGETSQNLERVLTRTRHLDVVLLFDEADALFGRRTEIKDAHDRFANTDTNYLLQAIESYRGVALLSSNKQANMDPAFARRLRHVIGFPKPDRAQRERLWRRIVGELAGPERVAALDRELAALADGVETTGAQIKFATLGAVFAARRDGAPLEMAHLLRGVEREMLKEGRALSERERERLVGRGR